MLKIQYTRAFLKQFKKLSPTMRKKAKDSIKIFEKDPKNKALKAHKLNGELKDFYSFSVDYKYRVVFEINKKTKVVNLLKVGNHGVYE